MKSWWSYSAHDHDSACDLEPPCQEYVLRSEAEAEIREKIGKVNCVGCGEETSMWALCPECSDRKADNTAKARIAEAVQREREEIIAYVQERLDIPNLEGAAYAIFSNLKWFLNDRGVEEPKPKGTESLEDSPWETGIRRGIVIVPKPKGKIERLIMYYVEDNVQSAKVLAIKINELVDAVNARREEK